jgi:hypothetical protein
MSLAHRLLNRGVSAAIERSGAMKLVDKKTRKTIRKSVKKLIKKHGPELAAALAGGALSQKLSDALTGEDRKSVRKKKRIGAKSKKTKRHVRKPAAAEPLQTT